MKPEEQDALLARLDERSRNTWGAVEKMERHLAELNGQVRTNTMFRKAGTFVSCAVVVALITMAINLIGK